MQQNHFRELLEKYLKYKFWILGTILLSLGLAYLYLRYATPKYQANAVIQIVEDKNSASELSLFNDLNILTGSSKKVEDEIEVLRSRSNIREVVINLGLNTRVSHVGRVKSSEIYGNIPVKISLDTVSKDIKFACYIIPQSETKFTFWTDEYDNQRSLTFGEEIRTRAGRLIILPDEGTSFKPFIGETLRVEILPLDEVTLQYQDALETTIVDDYSSIINLSMKDAVKEKALDFLNELIRIYNFNGANDKKRVADRTAEFIDERIADIYNDLSESDQSAEDFLAGRGLTDIQSQSNINLNVSAASQQELQDAQVQLQIANNVNELIASQEGYEILPSNLGISDPSVTAITERYNQLVSERERLLKSSNEKNPVIVNIDKQLDNLKEGMKSSLSSASNNLTLRVNNLSSQLATLNSKIYSAPRYERALREITRKQQTAEGLYLYLLQKREEAQIAYASASPNSKIVDSAFLGSKKPVSPKKAIIYLAALLMGALVPIGFIHAREILDDKVHNAHGLEKLVSDVPVIGELPRLSKKANILIEKDDRSVLSEALRIIRTNMDFLLRSQLKEQGRNPVIYVTSNLPKEGKTFFSSNLALILSNSGKRILLIGADIRDPKFHLFFESNSKSGPENKLRLRDNIGLTEYIVNEKFGLSDIVKTQQVSGNEIDVIYSGKRFPNPSELLMNPRVKELLKEASRTYDYVIVDTSPMMPVTDTLLISPFADLMVYITRAGKTSIDEIKFPMKLKEQGKLPPLALVVNGVKSSALGYGGKYGYGYGKSNKKWWNF